MSTRGPLLYFILLLCIQFSVTAQPSEKYYTKESFSTQIDKLRSLYGERKVIPEKYEAATLAALSHYPELAHTAIEFIEAPIHATMMAQPKALGPKNSKERSYIIFINNAIANTGFLPSDLSFNQFVGVMGHELAHISYFTGRTDLQLYIDALGYYLKDYRRSFEAATDKITLDHGLGWQLIDFSDYVAQCKTLSPSYQKKKKKIYLDSQDLIREMNKRMAPSR